MLPITYPLPVSMLSALLNYIPILAEIYLPFNILFYFVLHHALLITSLFAYCALVTCCIALPILPHYPLVYRGCVRLQIPLILYQ